MNLRDSVRRKLEEETKYDPACCKCTSEITYPEVPDCIGEPCNKSTNCRAGCYCDNDTSMINFLDRELKLSSKTTQSDDKLKKPRRTKEQTTAGAAGAYSQPLFSEPMRKKIEIKESELISLIEKSIYGAQHGRVIKEALTDADEKKIGVIARRELKDYEIKLEKKIDQLIKKSFKGKDFEDKTIKIAKNAIVQLYKALWIRRTFWSEYIKNVPS